MYKNFYNRPCSNLLRTTYDELCYKSIDELNVFLKKDLAKNIIPHVEKGTESEAFVRIPDDMMDGRTQPYIKSEEDRLGFLFHIYVFTYSRRYKKNVFRHFEDFKKQFDLGEKTGITDLQDDLDGKTFWEIKITYHFTKGFILEFDKSCLKSNTEELKEVKQKSKNIQPKQIEIKEETEIQKIEKQLKQIEKKLGKNKAEKDKEYFELSKKLYNLKNPYHDPDEELPF